MLDEWLPDNDPCGLFGPIVEDASLPPHFVLRGLSNRGREESFAVKIVITSQGPELRSSVDPRFGRAQYFVVYDTQTQQHSAHSNEQNLQAVQGAGIQAGRQVVDLGAEAVLTGHVGPKAFATLKAGGVAVYTGIQGTVQEALEQFQAGSLQPSDKANVEGHWM